MAASGKSKGGTLTDPLFGEVTYDGKGSWAGSVTFGPVSDVVSVIIAAGGGGPTEEHRKAFRELTKRYDDLSTQIADELFALYEPHQREHHEGRAPRPGGPGAMWDMLMLDWILVEDGDRLKLGYGFVDGSGWDDAMFTVRVEGWVATGESLDD
jgi:hypothetical protein